jgi:hypothetical protein
MSAGELDLNWYAGRVRMMGGRGLALLLAGYVAAFLGFSWSVLLFFVIAGIVAIFIALYRSNKFDMYVAAASAVLLHQGPDLKKLSDET